MTLGRNLFQTLNTLGIKIMQNRTFIHPDRPRISQFLAKSGVFDGVYELDLNVNPTSKLFGLEINTLPIPWWIFWQFILFLFVLTFAVYREAWRRMDPSWIDVRLNLKEGTRAWKNILWPNIR